MIPACPWRLANAEAMASFQAEFHRIQQALRKGLFRKVDYGGSAEELLELGAALRREGNAPHAALCLMAAAQCHRALEQPGVAAHHDAQAGQLLWREQLQLLARVDDAVFRDLVPEATACFLGAIHVHLAQEHRALAGSLYAEMADFLWALGNGRSLAPRCRWRAAGRGVGALTCACFARRSPARRRHVL